MTPVPLFKSSYLTVFLVSLFWTCRQAGPCGDENAIRRRMQI